MLQVSCCVSQGIFYFGVWRLGDIESSCSVIAVLLSRMMGMGLVCHDPSRSISRSFKDFSLSVLSFLDWESKGFHVAVSAPPRAGAGVVCSIECCQRFTCRVDM